MTPPRSMVRTRPDGTRVVFYVGNPDDGAPIACETVVPAVLEPGACARVSCPWTVPAWSERMARGVTAIVDPDDVVPECYEANNRSTVPERCCEDDAIE